MKHPSRWILELCLIAGFALMLPVTGVGQKKKEAAKPAASTAPAAPSAPATDYNAILKGVKFREIGPATMGGRIDDFAVVESDPNIIYVGTASGGVFKSINGGTTWEPIFAHESTSTIGDVTLAPSDPQIVWVGTGEANNRQSSSWGDGVFKSTDGGKTWQQMGLRETQAIGRIVIDPRDPNIVYVAAVGRLWGPSKERGVYKSTDGGATWKQVLFVNEDTGATDIAMDPQSPGTLIAGFYQRRRTVFGYNGGGPGSGLYKTTDGGATWKKLEKGLPWDPNPPTAAPAFGGGPGGGGGGGGGRAAAAAGAAAAAAGDRQVPAEAKDEIGRMAVEFYRRNGNIVYALVEHAGGGIYRSEDRGETWTKMSDTNPRPSYYSQVRIDPNNDQRIWVLGAAMYVSDDGGRTFRQNIVQRIHTDFHAMWIDPANSNHMLTGCDGGIHISYDRGRTWDFDNTIPLGQFYEIGLDMAKPYKICGGLQDNNAWCGPSATMDAAGISNSDWFTVGGGDGFYAQVDPTDPNIVYAESQDGNVLRRNLRTHESKSIRPIPPDGEPPYRFQWNSPIVISSFDPHTVYYGGNYLFRSRDQGDGWERLGPDLTTGVDRNKLEIFGKVPTQWTLSRHDGVQNYPAITTISESPANRDVLWVGTDDGNLQVTRDSGKNWKNVASKVPGLPKGTYVSRVVASKHAEGTAYATFDGHRSNDFNVYVFMTTDYGDTWKSIRNGLPDDQGTVHVIREHFRNPKLLFLGTEHGLYVSFDQGSRWSRLTLNLPTVPVDDIQIHPRDNDLVLATHGRSIWILDDITPLEQMSEATAGQEFKLFDTRSAIEWRIANRGGDTGHKLFLGANPPNGAIVNYYLKTKLGKDERVRVTVSDKDGKTVRTITNGTGDAGLNRVIWDFRGNSLTATPGGGGGEGQQEGEPGGGFGGFGFFGGGFGGGGLRVEPGEYTIKVTAGKLEQSTKVTVEEDPRIMLSPQERAARRQALDQLARLAATVMASSRTITGMRTSLNTFVESAKRPGGARVPDNIQASAADLLKRVDESCKRFAAVAQCGGRAAGLGNAGPPLEYTPPTLTQRVVQVIGQMEGFTAGPTAWQLDQIRILQGLVTEASGNVRKLAQDDLGALNKAINDAGVPHIVIPGGGRPGAAAAGGNPDADPAEVPEP